MLEVSSAQAVGSKEVGVQPVELELRVVSELGLEDQLVQFEEGSRRRYRILQSPG